MKYVCMYECTKVKKIIYIYINKKLEMTLNCMAMPLTPGLHDEALKTEDRGMPS